jgi:hypothetical protein
MTSAFESIQLAQFEEILALGSLQDVQVEPIQLQLFEQSITHPELPLISEGVPL